MTRGLIGDHMKAGIANDAIEETRQTTVCVTALESLKGGVPRVVAEQWNAQVYEPFQLSSRWGLRWLEIPISRK